NTLQERRKAKLAALDVSWETPLAEWKPKTIDVLWETLRPLLETELTETTNEKLSVKLEACRGELPCPDCGGARLRPEARNVRVAGLAIHETTRMAVGAALTHFAGLTFSSTRAPIALPLVQEIVGRLKFLIKVGLDYL